MSAIDDDRPAPVPKHEVGGDLATLSVAEIDQRIALLREEITRLEDERRRKDASRSAADSLFR